MRTVSERLDEIEARLQQAELGQRLMVTAAYGLVQAAVDTLKDNRAIQGIHLKLIKDAMQTAVTEALASRPDLLDDLRYVHFPRRWHEG